MSARRDDTLTEISVEFNGSPGDARDLECESIFEAHGATFVHCGALLTSPPVRDRTYDVPNENVRALKRALRAAKFRTVDIEFGQVGGQGAPFFARILPPPGAKP
jgi:hypothetical protein